MAGVHCQLDWVSNHYGNPSVSMSVRCCPEDFTEEGIPTLNGVGHYSVGWGPGLNKKWAEHQLKSLSDTWMQPSPVTSRLQ